MKKMALGILMLGMVNVSFSNMSDIDIEAKLVEGKNYIENGDYDKGLERLDEYLKTTTNPEAFAYFARAQRGLGNLVASNHTAEKAIEMYPENKEVLYERVLTLEKLKATDLEPVKKEDQDEKDVLTYEDAYYEAYETYLEMIHYSDGEKIFKLGNDYFVNDLYEKARDVFYKDRTGNIKNQFGAATTTRFLGDYKRSISIYTRVIDTDPNFYEAYLGRGVAYQLSGDFKRGISDMERYLEYKKDVDVYIAIANMYMSSEKYSSAKSVLERASGNFPSSTDVRELLVEVYSKLNRN